MPPAALTMKTGFRLARSMMTPTYASLAMSDASVTSTFSTVRPLICMPRMADAFSRASAASLASFTPPALPRPPACTCAFTTTCFPIRAAICCTSSGVVATSPGGIGTPRARRISFAWYSWMFTDASGGTGRRASYWGSTSRSRRRRAQQPTQCLVCGTKPGPVTTPHRLAHGLIQRIHAPAEILRRHWHVSDHGIRQPRRIHQRASRADAFLASYRGQQNLRYAVRPDDVLRLQGDEPVNRGHDANRAGEWSRRARTRLRGIRRCLQFGCDTGPSKPVGR